MLSDKKRVLELEDLSLYQYLTLTCFSTIRPELNFKLGGPVILIKTFAGPLVQSGRVDM